jgi:hypothetical protein
VLLHGLHLATELGTPSVHLGEGLCALIGHFGKGSGALFCHLGEPLGALLGDLCDRTFESRPGRRHKLGH